MSKSTNCLRKLLIKIPIHISISIAFIIAVGAGVCIYSVASGRDVISTKAESYTEDEFQLYTNVKTYLTDMLSNDGEDNEKVADDAVKNYNTILSSGVMEITKDHTNAIKKNMEQSIQKNIPNAQESLTSDDLDILGADCTSFILEAIIKQMEEMSTEEVKNSKSYLTLHDSLQEQIEDLKSAQMKVTISANVSDNYIDKEQLLKVLGEFSPEEKEKYLDNLAKILGISKVELMEKINGEDKQLKINDDALAFIESLTSSDIQKLKNGNKGATGKKGDKGEKGDKGDRGETGMRGATGATGATGARGATGEKGDKGAKGDSAYVHIKYATDDPTKNGSAKVSSVPTADTKYMGVYNSNTVSAPSDWTLYTWTQYKDLSISAVVDEDGVTNLIIH